jgi:hypothetical protein
MTTLSAGLFAGSLYNPGIRRSNYHPYNQTVFQKPDGEPSSSRSDKHSRFIVYIEMKWHSKGMGRTTTPRPPAAPPANAEAEAEAIRRFVLTLFGPKDGEAADGDSGAGKTPIMQADREPANAAGLKAARPRPPR